MYFILFFKNIQITIRTVNDDEEDDHSRKGKRSYEKKNRTLFVEPFYRLELEAARRRRWSLSGFPNTLVWLGGGLGTGFRLRNKKKRKVQKREHGEGWGRE